MKIFSTKLSLFVIAWFKFGPAQPIKSLLESRNLTTHTGHAVPQNLPSASRNYDKIRKKKTFFLSPLVFEGGCQLIKGNLKIFFLIIFLTQR